MFTTKWTDEKVDLLMERYHNTKNAELARWLGLGQRTVERKAHELGLSKDESFLRMVRMDGLREIDYLRICGKRMGPPKGLRCNPKGEFKKGHKESVFTRARRIAAIKASYEMKKVFKTK